MQGVPGVGWKTLADITADLKTVGFPKVNFERSMLPFFSQWLMQAFRLNGVPADIKHVCFVPNSEHFGQNTYFR